MRPWPSYGPARCPSTPTRRRPRVEFPRPDCPSCSLPMTFWSGYRRHVREAGRCQQIFVAEARCRGCAIDPRPAALLSCSPAASTSAETIGTVLEDVVDGPERGAPGGSTRRGPPHDGAGMAAALLRRGAEDSPSRSRRSPSSSAASAISPCADPAPPRDRRDRRRLRGRDRVCRAGPRRPVALRLVGERREAACHQHDSPYLVVGRRRFMPPVPLPDDKEDRSHGT